MKIRIACFCMFALFAHQAFAQSAPTAQASETSTPATKAQTKDDLLKYMRETRDNFTKSVSGLSDAQLKFKAAPDKWSVMEVSEHIALSENLFNGMVVKMMTAPAADKKAEMYGKEDAIVSKITDRTHKAQAPDMLKPTGKWPTEAEILKAFNDTREKNIAFVINTPEADLRSHMGNGPVGELDAHEWMLFMASHTARHTKQIEEVKADPNFPK